MITSYTVDNETKEVSGIYSGENFILSPKIVNEDIVALTQDECIEIITLRKLSEQYYINNSYKAFRIDEYPPIGDQLDALWKGGEAAAEMLAKVQAVKAKYPKPEEI